MFRQYVDSEINLILLQEPLADELFRLIDNDRQYLNRWLAWPSYVKSMDDTKAFIKQSLHDFADQKSLTCAIEFQQQVVGVISFNKIHQSLKKVELGYWLGSGWQGRGIVTRGCRHLVQYAFDSGMEKIQISVAEDNQSSRNICERLGFTLEGVISNAENVQGKVLNHAVYGLHKSCYRF